MNILCSWDWWHSRDEFPARLLEERTYKNIPNNPHTECFSLFHTLALFFLTWDCQAELIRILEETAKVSTVNFAFIRGGNLSKSSDLIQIDSWGHNSIQNWCLILNPISIQYMHSFKIYGQKKQTMHISIELKLNTNSRIKQQLLVLIERELFKL